MKLLPVILFVVLMAWIGAACTRTVYVDRYPPRRDNGWHKKPGYPYARRHIPPGQAKKRGYYGGLPPGQAKKRGYYGGLPPGQVKKRGWY